MRYLALPPELSVQVSVVRVAVGAFATRSVGAVSATNVKLLAVTAVVLELATVYGAVAVVPVGASVVFGVVTGVPTPAVLVAELSTVGVVMPTASVTALIALVMVLTTVAVMLGSGGGDVGVGAGVGLRATTTGFVVLGGTTIGVTVVVAATTVGWLVAPVLVLQHT